MDSIYLDYAASAPLYPEAHAAIEHFLKSNSVGNPSSVHTHGRNMQAYLDKAHTTLAAVFGVHPTEVVFTSGATESNMLAIRGVLQAWRQHNKGTPHIVLSGIEHPSWRAVAQSEGADITLVAPTKDGVVLAEAMIQEIQENTVLVGCMYVNNELGTVLPIAAVGKGIAELRSHTKRDWPVFHVDAVQAFPYLNTHSGHMHADIVTLSGHKYGALGGIGAILIKKQTPMQSLLRGGGQEWGHRAGTENVLGALTLAAVVAWADEHRTQATNHAGHVQQALESRISRELPNAHVLGQNVERAPHISYLWLPGVLDEHVVHKLDLAGVSVSSGSACSSGAMLPSTTLLALGYSEHEAFGGIRVSYGRFTTLEEIKQFVVKLKEILG